MAKKHSVVTGVESCLTQAHRMERLNEPHPPQVRALFEKGNQVGEAARQQLGVGQYIGYMRTPIAALLTTEALTSGASMVYEGTVVDSYGQAARLDAMEVMGQNPVSITNREVKSAGKKKNKDIIDAAVSTKRARDAGLVVPETMLMHVNKDNRLGNTEPALSEVNITDEVEEVIVSNIIDHVEGVIDSSTEPAPVLKKSCRQNPMSGGGRCRFYEQCHGTTAHPVIEYQRLTNDQYQLFHDNGWTDVMDVPDEHLKPKQLMYKQSLMDGRVVNVPRLTASLAGIPAGPVHHLDFETSTLAVPMIPDARPWEQVPEQFSMHLEGDELEHVQYLSPLDGQDNRRRVAEQLVQAVGPEGPIIVWGISMEGPVIRKLATLFPDLSEDLQSIGRRLVDLKPIVQKSITDPDFHGSYGLKSVAPILSPGFNYEGLEIRSGGDAGGYLALMILGFEDPESAELRDALLRYCERDTLATIHILQALRTMI